METETRLLTVDEVAERLSVSRATVYNLCQSGELPYRKVRRCRRITAADLEAYIVNLPVYGGVTNA